MNVSQKQCTTVFKISLQSLPFQEISLRSAPVYVLYTVLLNSHQQLCKVDCVVPSLQMGKQTQNLSDFREVTHAAPKINKDA